MVLLGAGWALLGLGVVGLLLPGLQGLLMIVVGAAVLSVASDTVHRWMQRLLARHPSWRQRLDDFRHKLHSRLSRHR
jgi:uncharacterized membrane protein YbaN (DUF454 family)